MKARKKMFLMAATLAMTSAGTAAADSGWYAGGSVGQAFIDERIANIQLDADSTTFRVFGGYAFGDHIALEASYLDFGTFRDTVDAGGVPVPVSADADGFSLSVVGRLPVSERWSLHGKAGLFFWDGQSTVNGITENDPGEQNAYLGAGLGYDLSEHARVFLDAEYYDLDGVEPLVASLGFAFRF